MRPGRRATVIVTPIKMLDLFANYGQGWAELFGFYYAQGAEER